MLSMAMLLRSSSSPLLFDSLASPAGSSPSEIRQRSRGDKFLSSACSHPLLRADSAIASTRLPEVRPPSSETLGSGSDCSSSSASEVSSPGCPPHPLSLGSLPFELPSVCFHGGSVGNYLPVLEESEPLFSCTSSTTDMDNRSWGFDMIGLPVHKFMQVRHPGPELLIDRGGDRGGRPRPRTGGSGDGDDAGDHRGSSSGIADEHYKQMLQMDPGNPLLLGNYARYLSDVKHDYCKAEAFYQRAILASPGDGELLRQYAELLWEVRHDATRAAMYFERAIQAAPDNSYVRAAYASFLWSSEDDEQEQEEKGGFSAGGSSAFEFPASFPSLISAGFA